MSSSSSSKPELRERADVHPEIPRDKLDKHQRVTREIAEYVDECFYGTHLEVEKIHDYDFVLGVYEVPVKICVDVRTPYQGAEHDDNWSLVLFETEGTEVYDQENDFLVSIEPQYATSGGYLGPTGSAIAAFAKAWLANPSGNAGEEISSGDVQ